MLTKYDILLNWITENAQNILIYAIHCDTNEKAENLIAMLYSMGFRWENDDLANKHFEEDGTITTKWKAKGRQTCYSVTSTKIILYGSLSFYNSQGKIIVEYDELFADSSDENQIVNSDELKKEFIDELPQNDNIVPTEVDDISQLDILEKRNCPICHSDILNDGGKFCMECGFEIPPNFFVELPTKTSNPERSHNNDPVIANVEPENDVEDVFLPDTVENVQTVDNVQTNEHNNVSNHNDKNKSRKKTVIQIILIGVIILMFGSVIFGVNVIKSNLSNNYGQFSENWQIIEQTTESQTQNQSETKTQPQNTTTQSASTKTNN